MRMTEAQRLNEEQRARFLRTVNDRLDTYELMGYRVAGWDEATKADGDVAIALVLRRTEGAR